jgi:ABC-type transport system involved in multi-copper enzyme maturation permease subunit
MNPRLAKELRALALPWCVAAFAGMTLHLLRLSIALGFIEEGDFLNFVQALVGFAFVGALLALAATPWGSEFQQRTLPLLLSQPIPRSRLWRDKLLAAFLAMFSALLLEGLSRLLTGSVTSSLSGVVLPDEFELLVAAWLIPTLCSVVYWALLARSTIGGMVFTVSTQFLVLGLVVWVGENVGITDVAKNTILVLAGVIYSSLFLRFSWRKFARFQVSQLSPDSLAASKPLVALGLRLNWLRCRPTSGILNLVRKELQLQKPLFILAAILCAVWIFAGLLAVFVPSKRTLPQVPEGTFAGIALVLSIVFYVPLMALLGGCVSLGEEKNLGLTAWHLTFPISVRRQWAMKLAVGLATWFLLGVVLPYILACIGAWMSTRGTLSPHTFSNAEFETWFGISLFAGGVFAVSFWAMTLFSNTLRAVIASLAMISVLCCSAALGCWIVVQVEGQQVFGMNSSRWDSYVWLVLTTAAALLALIQSLIQFRRLQTSPRLVAKYSSCLAAFVFVATFCYFLFRPFS